MQEFIMLQTEDGISIPVEVKDGKIQLTRTQLLQLQGRCEVYLCQSGQSPRRLVRWKTASLPAAFLPRTWRSFPLHTSRCQVHGILYGSLSMQKNERNSRTVCSSFCRCDSVLFSEYG